MVSCRSVAPYEELYGTHPSLFNFDANGKMVPPSPLGQFESPPESPAVEITQDRRAFPRTPGMRPTPETLPEGPCEEEEVVRPKVCFLPVPCRRKAAAPSAGSVLHGTGECRPCDAFHTRSGCAKGAECPDCHLCCAGEFQRRREQAEAARKAMVGVTAHAVSSHGVAVVGILKRPKPPPLEML